MRVNRTNSKLRIAVLGATTLLLGALAAAGQEAEHLTLKRAVALALQNSRDLALARIQYSVAQNTTRLARAEFLPNVYTGSGLGYTNGFPQTPSGAPPSLFTVDYVQSVLNPGLRGQFRADQERAQSQRIEFEKAREQVMVQAASAYLELAKVRHSLDLLRSERSSAEKILQVTRERASAGLELPLEVTKGELSQAKIEQHIVQLESREQILDEQLHDLTGVPPDQPIEVETEELPASAEQAAGELIHMAQEHSPEVQEAEHEGSAREHLLKGAQQSYWPSVDLVGEYSILSKFNNFDVFFRRFQRNNVNAGVQVRIPIFSAKTHAAAALARSQFNAAETDLGNKRRQLRLDTQQKIRTLREAQAGQEVARLDLQLAQESMGILQSKFNEGRSTLRDLEQARLEENEKWLAFLDADFARQQAQLGLLQSTGQLAQVLQ